MPQGRPKNDGVLLAVRISHAAHSALAQVRGYKARQVRPAENTNGKAVEEALAMYLGELAKADEGANHG